MTRLSQQKLDEAKKQADTMARLLTEGREVDLSSPQGIAHLKSVNDSLCNEFAKMEEIMKGLYEDLPDGRRVFIPDAECLRAIAEANQESEQFILEGATITDGRVTALRASVRNLAALEGLDALRAVLAPSSANVEENRRAFDAIFAREGRVFFVR